MTVMQELLCASLEAWYHTIWLPRCQRTMSQERDQGLHQGAKLRKMRASRGRTSASPTSSSSSPTPNLPPSFPDTFKDRSNAHHRFLSQLMRGIAAR